MTRRILLTLAFVFAVWAGASANAGAAVERAAAPECTATWQRWYIAPGVFFICNPYSSPPTWTGPYYEPGGGSGGCFRKPDAAVPAVFVTRVDVKRNRTQLYEPPPGNGIEAACM